MLDLSSFIKASESLRGHSFGSFSLLVIEYNEFQRRDFYKKRLL